MPTDQKKRKMRNGIKLLVFIIILFSITVGFIFFGEAIKNFFQSIVNRYGLMGLFVLTVIMDSLIQPISPDILTVGYSMSSTTGTLMVSLAGGIASVIAGLIGYSIGHFLEEEGADKFIGKKNYQKAHKLFEKHGFWAILIGAISPVPFSAICWSAGVFKMPWKFFLISILVTRVPRFLVAGYIGMLLSD